MQPGPKLKLVANIKIYYTSFFITVSKSGITVQI